MIEFRTTNHNLILTIGIMTSHAKIWLHLIIATQNKLPLILADNEQKIFTILKDCFLNQNCKIDALNGYSEHIHCKILMNTEKSLDEIVHNALNESEQIINQELFKAGSFRWSNEYAVFSISESQLTKVTEYIESQKELHKQKSYQKEIDEFYRLHRIE